MYLAGDATETEHADGRGTYSVDNHSYPENYALPGNVTTMSLIKQHKTCSIYVMICEAAFEYICQCMVCNMRYFRFYSFYT